MKLFAAAFGAMVNNYIDPLDPVTLIDAAIAGMDAAPAATPRDADSLVEAAITAMVAAADQDSAYLNPELFEELQVLTIRRDGASELYPTITRKVILLRSVTFQRTGETYGYIRISQFNEGTDASVRDALSSRLAPSVDTPSIEWPDLTSCPQCCPHPLPVGGRAAH